MKRNLFTYGTLQFPQVLKKITGKRFAMAPAVLNGYKRLLVKGTDYPAIIENTNSKVYGNLLKNVDQVSMKSIFEFEGIDYELKHLKVEVGSELFSAVAFVWRADFNLLDKTDWDKDEFEKKALHFYI